MMLIFNNGQYLFNGKYIVRVEDGVITISPDFPAFVKTAELFNPDNWEDVLE